MYQSTESVVVAYPHSFTGGESSPTVYLAHMSSPGLRTHVAVFRGRSAEAGSRSKRAGSGVRPNMAAL